LFASASRDSWVALLAATDCCFEPLLAPEEVAGHAHVMSRRLVEAAQGQALPAEIRFPVKVDGSTPCQRKPLREASAEAVAADWLAG
ncbi:MAG: hypothetical protein OEL80_07760, partial [Desulfuromonadales bacterium]|nr:hypothetical protein [Desulfuromonadales bacterium]